MFTVLQKARITLAIGPKFPDLTRIVAALIGMLPAPAEHPPAELHGATTQQQQQLWQQAWAAGGSAAVPPAPTQWQAHFQPPQQQQQEQWQYGGLGGATSLDLLLPEAPQ